MPDGVTGRVPAYVCIVLVDPINTPAPVQQVVAVVVSDDGGLEVHTSAIGDGGEVSDLDSDSLSKELSHRVLHVERVDVLS